MAIRVRLNVYCDACGSGEDYWCDTREIPVQTLGWHPHLPSGWEVRSLKREFDGLALPAALDRTFITLCPVCAREHENKTITMKDLRNG